MNGIEYKYNVNHDIQCILDVITISFMETIAMGQIFYTLLHGRFIENLSGYLKYLLNLRYGLNMSYSAIDLKIKSNWSKVLFVALRF